MVRRHPSLPTEISLAWSVIVFAALLPTTLTAQPGAEQKVVASDPDTFDEFGRSVDVFGDFAVIGAPGDSEEANGAGAAYVFHYAAGTWTQIQKLTADDDAVANDEFGFDVSVERNLIAVGAPGDDDAGNDAGAAYLFEWDGNTWSEIHKLLPNDANNDAYAFGTAVDIGISFPDEGVSPEQTNVAVGAPVADNFEGAVFFYVRTNTNTWDPIGRFQDSDGAAPTMRGQTGTSVAIRGDVLIMGAPFHDQPQPLNEVGAAYGFGRGQIVNSWAETAPYYPVGPPAPFGSDLFGASVAVDKQFDVYTVVIGAPRFSTLHTGYVTIHDPAGGTQVFTESTAHNYGATVAIDGGTVVVGAPRDDTNGQDAGAIYFLTRDGSGIWSPAGMLQASDVAQEKQFGTSVASRHGSLIVGSPERGTIPGPGAAYLYTSILFRDGFESGTTAAWQ
ncbi:MAG: FG-GAP repeat protein [Thermoanaerobaculia bacterium]|nr:FG-GAP repeat protein [Thermoanaerobaculia bacterium]